MLVIVYRMKHSTTYILLFITAKQKYFPGVKHLKQKHRSLIIERTYKFSLKIKHNTQIYKAS